MSGYSKKTYSDILNIMPVGASLSYRDIQSRLQQPLSYRTIRGAVCELVDEGLVKRTDGYYHVPFFERVADGVDG